MLRDARAWAFTATASHRRACRLLVTLAVCTLPAAQRARYAEELRDELLELPHGEQLGYALRLLGRSWQLRHVLNDSFRNSRVPRPRPIPGFTTVAVVAAVLVLAFSGGAGFGAPTAEPEDRLWPMTKILYTERAHRCVKAAAEARALLQEASDALADGRTGEAQITLGRADDELRAVNDEASC